MKIKGFTLIELMITMTVSAILLAIAVPSYQSVTTNMRMSNEINALSSDLNFARSEAVKRGLNINVCPPLNGVCNAGPNLDWAAGWMVFDAGAVKQLRISSGVNQGDTFKGGATPITFTPAGYTQFAGTITLHNKNNDADQRRCIVFATGAWNIQKGAICP